MASGPFVSSGSTALVNLMNHMPIGESRRRFRSLWPIVVVSLSAGVHPGVDAAVELNVARVGFPALGASDVVRAGQWVPVIVDMALIDQPSFDGSLRVGQLDGDGDECYDHVEVHLRAETGGSQRYFLYALANPADNHGRFIVTLYDDERETVQVVSQGELTDQAESPQRPSSIGDDELLILSLSTGAIGKLNKLVGGDLYLRSVHVAHMSPLDLPELWIGLEAVDFIVWDDARPEDLTERQIHALVEWVHQGGILLLAASRSTGSVKMSAPIYDILPVEIGDLTTVENLPELRRRLLGSPISERQRSRRETDDWWTEPYPAPVTVTECTLRDGAVSIPDRTEDALIARHRVGRGHVLFSGVILSDFFSGEGEPNEFFEDLFHLKRLDTEEARANPASLFGRVVSAVGFATRGMTMLLIAGALSLIYVLAATLGSWRLLGSRGWRHHSWSAFGLVAIAASLLSVFAVGGIRGFGGETLHQISIVDANAGEPTGFATAFFGVKTGMDKTVDFWLPSDAMGASDPYATECFLRPLPVSGSALDDRTPFADPEVYRLEPGSAVIDDVRVRATLKRLEGRWRGLLDGTVTGKVLVDRYRKAIILDGSYISNELGVDLRDCYLLHAVVNLDIESGPRSKFVNAYPLGDLPAGGDRFDLSSRCNPPEGVDEEEEQQRREEFQLFKAHGEWRSNFGGLFADFGYGRSASRGVAVGQEKNALRLLSTLGDYDPQAHAGLGSTVMGLATFSRDRLRHLDLREQLTTDSVILIGFADDPGPVRLFRRTGDRPFRALTPADHASWTMYRIRIPVTLVGGPDKTET